MYPIAQEFKRIGSKLTVIIGARNKDLIVFEQEMKSIADELIITTDDGSYGRKALVTAPLKELCEKDVPPDEVFAIGNLSNYGIGITKGHVSVPKINIIVDGNKKEVIQCDITIVSGSSGGALVNRNGKLIGITTFRTKDNLGNVIHGIGYVIPINRVLEYIK
mgnify:CR=1 FL=1